MPFENILIEQHGLVATVTINRPKILNALSIAILHELRHAFLDFGRDDTIRAVVITGAGERAFVAGADINELAAQSPDEGRAFARLGQSVFAQIERLGKPVVAAINGVALGGGCELAMACTLRVAADTAMLGQPEIQLGVLPGYGGTQRLPRLVGQGKALELLLLGTPITAAEAQRIGLVNRVVAPADLLAEAQSLASALAGQAPVATRYIIEAVNCGLGMALADGCELEATLFGLVTATNDMREGTRAFLEKRRPRFEGR